VKNIFAPLQYLQRQKGFTAIILSLIFHLPSVAKGGRRVKSWLSKGKT
jgi:hypothetical protein